MFVAQEPRFAGIAIGHDSAGNGLVCYFDIQVVITLCPFTLSGTISTATGITNRFRLLLVGTNQGWLHAFGEVTNVTTIQAPDPNAGQEKVNGSVDELWSFMPTDFLANLNYINVPTNPHRFMVDGTPSIYFLDLPASAGGIGNGGRW